MSKQTLSHHELVRYNYLMTNYNYLSEKEKNELAYLIDKMEVHSSPSFTQEPISLEENWDRTAGWKNDKRHSKRKKKKKSKLTKFFKFSFFLILTVLVGMLVMFFKGQLAINSSNTDIQPASTQTFNGQATSDGINILILGTDKRPIDGETDARTDSIMVLNIGNSSGTPKLISFMRDTLVYIDGVSDWGADSKINSAFTIGQQEGNLGAETIRQVLKDNFDLDISYYAMVDFETFAIAIDTLFPKGVAIDAQFSTVEGEVVSSVDVPDDLGFSSSGSLYQTIEVGEQIMDGKTLLNYARFRTDDAGDFGRTQRQQQVLSAIINQIKNPTKLFTGSEALGKVYALTSTNIDFPFILTNGLSTLLSSQNGIEQMTIPAQGDWIDTYDRYGGLGLSIDFDYYQQELADLGLR